jgi:superfamily II DNA helicase RecQ
MGLIQPEAVLAITATAGPRVVNDICLLLGLEKVQNISPASDNADSGVLVLKTDRDNIDVSAFVLSTQEERLSSVSSKSTLQ